MAAADFWLLATPLGMPWPPNKPFLCAVSETLKKSRFRTLNEVVALPPGLALRPSTAIAVLFLVRSVPRDQGDAVDAAAMDKVISNVNAMALYGARDTKPAIKKSYAAILRAGAPSAAVHFAITRLSSKCEKRYLYVEWVPVPFTCTAAPGTPQEAKAAAAAIQRARDAPGGIRGAAAAFAGDPAAAQLRPCASPQAVFVKSKGDAGKEYDDRKKPGTGGGASAAAPAGSASVDGDKPRPKRGRSPQRAVPRPGKARRARRSRNDGSASTSIIGSNEGGGARGGAKAAAAAPGESFAPSSAGGDYAAERQRGGGGLGRHPAAAVVPPRRVSAGAEDVFSRSESTQGARALPGVNTDRDKPSSAPAETVAAPRAQSHAAAAAASSAAAAAPAAAAAATTAAAAPLSGADSDTAAPAVSALQASARELLDAMRFSLTCSPAALRECAGHIQAARDALCRGPLLPLGDDDDDDDDGDDDEVAADAGSTAASAHRGGAPAAPSAPSSATSSSAAAAAAAPATAPAPSLLPQVSWGRAGAAHNFDDEPFSPSILDLAAGAGGGAIRSSGSVSGSASPPSLSSASAGLQPLAGGGRQRFYSSDDDGSVF